MPIQIKKNKKAVKPKVVKPKGATQRQSQNVRQSVIVNLQGGKGRGVKRSAKSAVTRIVQEPIYLQAASYPQPQRQDIKEPQRQDIKELTGIFNKQLNDAFLSRFNLAEPKPVFDPIMKGPEVPKSNLFEDEQKLMGQEDINRADPAQFYNRNLGGGGRVAMEEARDVRRALQLSQKTGSEVPLDLLISGVYNLEGQNRRPVPTREQRERLFNAGYPYRGDETGVKISPKKKK